MAGIGLPHADDRDAIAAPLGRQPEIDDLRELLLEERDENLVQRLAQHGRLVRRAAREGRKVNRIAAHGDRRDGEDREFLDGIIIACVVAVGPFVGVFFQRHMAFQHDLGFGGDFQRHGPAIDQLGLPPAEQSGEMIFRQRLWNRRHRGEDDSGVGADDRGGGQGLAFFALPAAMMLRAAPVGEPAHDRPVAPDHLHTVDAEIEGVFARLCRAFRHDKRPGDERRRLPRPAGLDGEFAKVDIGACQHDFLTGRGSERPRRGAHRHHVSREGDQLQRILQTRGRLRLAQESERPADLAQRLGAGALFAPEGHPHRDALHRAEKIDQHRDRRNRPVRHHRLFKQDGRALTGEEPRLDLRHFKDGRDRMGNARQFARSFQPRHEIAKGFIAHGGVLTGRRLKSMRRAGAFASANPRPASRLRHFTAGAGATSCGGRQA